MRAVHSLPHLAADVLADLPRILARGGKARSHSVDAREIRQRFTVVCAFDLGPCWRRPERRQQPAPQPCHVAWRAIEGEIEVHTNDPRDLIGPFDVPAHPVQVVGNTR